MSSERCLFSSLESHPPLFVHFASTETSSHPLQVCGTNSAVQWNCYTPRGSRVHIIEGRQPHRNQRMMEPTVASRIEVGYGSRPRFQTTHEAHMWCSGEPALFRWTEIHFRCGLQITISTCRILGLFMKNRPKSSSTVLCKLCATPLCRKKAAPFQYHLSYVACNIHCAHLPLQFLEH